jgi:hypothetical protein
MAVKAGVCPRCIGGSLQIEYQNDGFWHEWCLSCSYDRELSPGDPRIPRDKKIREACGSKGMAGGVFTNFER